MKIKRCIAVLLLTALLPCAALAANYCPYCGTKVEEVYSFCPSCGKSLKSGSSGSIPSDSGNIPGFLHDLNGLRQVISTLVSKAVQNTGANGKAVYTENSFPLKLAFDLRGYNSLENHLDSQWMQSDPAGFSSAENYWRFYPQSMTYGAIGNHQDDARVTYQHRPNPASDDQWVTKMTYYEDFPSRRELIMIVSVDLSGTLTVVIGDTDINLTIKYVFDGKGNVLLYSKVPPRQKPIY